jgi:uncharacterized protein with FMN-binding domain
MKKAIIVLLCIGVVLGSAGAVALAHAKKVIREIEAEHAAMGEIPLAAINDGVYSGEMGSIPVYVNLNVTVKDHAIAGISINKQRSGKGYEAKEMPQRIVDAQKLKVDAVSGATLSSKCIMVATYRALKAAEK